VTLADVGFWSLEVGGLLWIAVTIVWICGIADLMTKTPGSRWPPPSRLDPDHPAVSLVGTLGYFFVRPTLPEERERMIAAQQSIRSTSHR
jgi:hypothetical protein